MHFHGCHRWSVRQTINSEAVESIVSAFLFSLYGFYYSSIDRALHVFAEASSGRSKRPSMSWDGVGVLEAR